MKTKLIPFDAEKAKNGAKVVTRNGLPVKILDYPVKNEDSPILGLILIEGKEFPKLFTKNGNHYSDCTESRLDLFIEEEVDEEDNYDPYKATVESIADMVEKYSELQSLEELKHFYNNVKVKCREAVEYDNTWCKQSKSKFKIEKGKWYVCIRDLFDDYENKAFRKGYIYLSTQDESIIPSNSNVPYKITCCADTYFRLWDIKDAKDGDILCYETKNEFRIFIYNKGCIHYHCLYYNEHLTTVDSFFVVQKHELSYIHPATKEQRDLLFQKMKEAGYDWFPNIKEIHKIGKEEVKTRRMAHQELADWLRDAPEEHREYRYAGDKDVYNTYDYPETEAKTPVDENRITIRRNHGEWQKPLIEE